MAIIEDQGDVVDWVNRTVFCEMVEPGRKSDAAKRCTKPVRDEENDPDNGEMRAAVDRWCMGSVYGRTTPSPDDGEIW